MSGLRRHFSNEERSEVNTETIVLITPRVVENLVEILDETWNTAPIEETQEHEREADAELALIEVDIDRFSRVDTAAADAAQSVGTATN